ncbi:MAG: hypothetical protein E7600_07370 [Ruminococcaceae bacterium]|nr:hypothetical protein [Oscillospiraceae bacterium]
MEHTQRESMVFYDSFFEAIRDLPAEEYKKCANAILMYGLRGEIPETAGIEKTIFVLVKPQIDKNNQRWINSKKSHAQKTQQKKQENETVKQEEKEILYKDAENSVEKQVENDEIVEMPNDMPEDLPEEQEFTAFEDEMIVSSCDSFSRDEETSKPPEQKKACGEFKNVYLTPHETEVLISQLGIREYLDRLEFFSGYLKRKPGHRSACHFIDMRDWVGKAVAERKPKAVSENPSFLDVEFEDIFEKP